jgi:tetratricopeptide (TPR) repeat protein
MLRRSTIAEPKPLQSTMDAQEVAMLQSINVRRQWAHGVGVLLLSLLGAGVAPAHAAEKGDQDVNALYMQAQTALSKGRPEEAVSLLGKAIDKEPTRADLYLLRARARDATGKYERALEDAGKYIELQPQDAYGYLSRSRIYSSLDKNNEALADASKAIELEPKEPDGYFRRADVYNEMGKKAEAKADEDKAAALDK